MIRVVIKTFDILELVAQRGGQGVTLTEISNELQMHQATASNIIKTMVAKMYLEHIGKKKGYRLGPSAYRLTNEALYGTHLISAAKDVMENLTAKLNETSILGTLRNNKRYVLHVVKSNQEIQVQVRTDRNAYETASGRLLIAYLSEKDLERFLQQNGLPDKKLWKEGSTIKGLTAALDSIRKSSMAITHLTDRHIRGYAVPVFAQDKVIAGLSIFLPDFRHKVVLEKLIIQSLNEAAATIQDRLYSIK